jgi:hypothetical protein
MKCTKPLYSTPELSYVLGHYNEMDVATLDVISYILAVLDDEYDRLVAAITALIKAEANVSLSDVYSQFMSYEARMEPRKSGDEASVNTVTRGGPWWCPWTWKISRPVS